jgi:hypothetical protein
MAIKTLQEIVVLQELFEYDTNSDIMSSEKPIFVDDDNGDIQDSENGTYDDFHEIDIDGDITPLP